MDKNSSDILTDARDHMALVLVMEAEIRKESDRCNQFRALKQWDEAMVTARGTRPTLVIDQCGQYIDQVINDWRRNRLGIKVSPADAPADDETARIIDGYIRQVEYQSKAHLAYDKAFECMTAMNRGFFKISTKRRKGSFRQDIVIKQIPNPDCVYMDPFCREVDYSDMRKCLITDRMSHAQFKAEYGKNANITDFSSYAADNQYANWITTDAVTVAEFWVVEEQPRKIQLLTAPIVVTRNGNPVVTDTVYDDEYEQLPEGVTVATNDDGELMEDDEPLRIVWQYILNGIEILEKTRWIGSYIPVVPMFGKEFYFEGKRRLFSLISRSLDAQRLFNYAQSSMAERLGQAPKNPVMGLTGQFKTDEKQWAAMNTTPFAFLNFDPVQLPDGSVYTGEPRRADFDPRIDQFVVASQVQKDNIKGTIGMYGSSLGAEDPKAKSGIAIEALQREGDNATFDFLDNGGRAIELCGTMILDVLPKILSGPDTIHIRDAQDKVIKVAINQDVAQMQQPPEGQERNFNLNEGSYHVAVSAAPSHQTLRQEGAQYSMEVFRVLPPQQQVQIAPVMLRLQDWYGAKEIADALDPQQKEGQKIPPQVQQAMQKLQMELQAINAYSQKLQQEQESKKLELDHKADIEKHKTTSEHNTKLEIERMKDGLERLKINTEWKIAQLKARTEAAVTHETLTTQENLAQHQTDSASTEAEKNRQHSSSESAANRDHETETKGVSS